MARPSAAAPPLTPAQSRRKIAAALTLEPLTLAARVGTYDPAQP